MPPEVESRLHEAIRFSRVMRPSWVVAAGASVGVGLAIYTLLGQLVSAANRQSLDLPFLIFGLLALPIVLTYAERAAVTLDEQGVYGLARASGLVWLTYGVGWLLLGGFVCLIALFGWGAALLINLSTERYFELSLDLRLLTVALSGMVTINHLVGTNWSWRSRSTTIYLSLITLVAVICLSLINPAPPIQSVRLLRNTQQVLPLTALLMTSLWSVYFILNFRNEIRRPTKTLLPVLLVTVGGISVIGFLAGVALVGYGLTLTLTPLIEILDETAFLPEELTILLYIGFGVLINLIALNQSLIGSLGLLEALTQDGFLPERLKQRLNTHSLNRLPLVLLVIFSMVLIMVWEVLTLMGLAALTFLVVTAAVHGPDALRSEPRLPKNRSPKLPFHPLFPWLTVAISVVLLFNLPHEVWWIGGAWSGVGAVFYLLYARRGGLAVRRQEILIGQPSNANQSETGGAVVMVAVTDYLRAAALLQAGRKVARSRKGQLLLVKVLCLAEQISPHLKQEMAQTEWEMLSAFAKQAGTSDVVVTPLVRLAPTLEAGLLESVREEKVDLLLLDWAPETTSIQSGEAILLDTILKWARCDVAILHGRLPDTIERALVPTAGGPHAPVALTLIRDLAEATDCQVQVEHMVTEPLTPDLTSQANTTLQTTIDKLKNAIPLQQQIIEARSVKSGILAEARQADVLLLGASNQGALEQTFFGGLPAEVAAATATPTIIVKGYHVGDQAWLRRFWAAFSDVLPVLTVERQTEVYEQMRSAAQPSVDFFVLITLAAMIASLGLLQNSAAVIIGAMLVAPLMSPILAMAMAIVNGNLSLLRTAAEATTQGIALAIFVGVGMTIISPIDTATPEILGRTAPTLLDLLVALASGAAAGYALSRKEVAAALPGVAIAAALVPPLCVVGFGLGTSQLDIATGALLLFTTNLIAIVFAAAGIFLALGFQPARPERGELLRGLKVTLVSLGAVFLILTLATITTVTQLNRQTRVEQIFRNEIVARSALVEELIITKQGHGFVIDGLIIDIVGNKLTPQVITQMQNELEAAVGGPVTIQAVVIPGQQQSYEAFDQRLRLENLFIARINELDAQVERIAVDLIDDGFVIEAGLLAFDDQTLNEAALTEIQETLSERMEAPVTIRTTILPAYQLNIEAPDPASPTEEPTTN
ncbi:MAG: DUF389 domain-containing protein [Anaerolineae bacterium]|nr:DUF389 domain-containing protein [Anaerolineae bacterium]